MILEAAPHVADVAGARADIQTCHKKTYRVVVLLRRGSVRT